MAQLNPSRYRKLGLTARYGTSDGIYYDETNNTLVLALGDTVVDVITASGSTADLEVTSEARGDILRRGASAWERHSAKTSGQILVGDGTDVVSVAVSGDATLSAAGAVAVTDLTIASEARGDLVRRGASDWARFSAKDSGKIVLGDGTDVISATMSGDASISAAGAVTVDNITVGSDAAGDINYKTAATTSSRLAIGTAGQTLRVNAGATAPTWSDDLERVVVEDFNALDTTDQVVVALPSGLVASGATGVMHHIYSPGGKIYCAASLGAGQTLMPAIVAAGLDIGGDQTDDEGWEIWSNWGGASGKPFIVGKDPAFYFTCKIQIGNADGLDHLMIGFRRAGPHLATFTDILDYSSIGVSTAADPMAIKLLTGLNGTDTNTDTTQTATEATAIQCKVLVSAAGVVTFQHDIVTPGTLAAPTATVAQTLDNGDPVIPFVRFLNVAAFATNIIIHKWEAGFQ